MGHPHHQRFHFEHTQVYENNNNGIMINFIDKELFILREAVHIFLNSLSSLQYFSLFVLAKAFLFVEQRCNRWVINVGAVVPVETGVDELRQCFAFNGFYRRLNTLVANTDGVLGDCAG